MVAAAPQGYRGSCESSVRSQAERRSASSVVRAWATKGNILKKVIILIAGLVAVLALTSGAFAASHYLITSPSQIKDGVISLSKLSPAARRALQGDSSLQGVAARQGQKGDTGPEGPQGPKGDTAGPAGPEGRHRLRGSAGSAGPRRHARQGRRTARRRQGRDRRQGRVLATASARTRPTLRTRASAVTTGRTTR